MESFKYEYVTIHSVKEEAERWWKYSESDVKTAKYLFEGKKYKDASFYCQQAVEKALKALLLKRGKKIIKVHDLVKLAKVLNLGEELIKDCERLSIVYIDTRYPDIGTKQYTKNETSEDIKIAKKVVKWIKKNL